jgi:hypothetical protein
VSPAKFPVPPVITKSIVNVAVPWPLAVPLPELVPSSVPLVKVSESVPFEMRMSGGLLKSMVDSDEGVNKPNVVSSPVPVKVWRKRWCTGGREGRVSLESPGYYVGSRWHDKARQDQYQTCNNSEDPRMCL